MVEAGTVDQEAGTVSGAHIYSDDGVFTVTVTVTDDDGASGSDTLGVTVDNVAPTVEVGADQTVDSGEAATVSATFTDPGAGDTHTATIDWGDGTTDPINPATSPVEATHTYADAGAYTVTVTVSDDDGGVGSDSLTVTVNNPPIF